MTAVLPSVIAEAYATTVATTPSLVASLHLRYLLTMSFLDRTSLPFLNADPVQKGLQVRIDVTSVSVSAVVPQSKAIVTVQLAVVPQVPR